MKNRCMKMVMAGLIASMCMVNSTAMVFAYDGNANTQETTETNGEDHYTNEWNDIFGQMQTGDDLSQIVTDDIAVDTKKDPDLDITFDVKEEGMTPGGVFTPDGNLTLVDDVEKETAEALQYMTVMTKGGNYFYIIIDRSAEEQNVYFLNTVDEADLMALMDDDTKAQLEKPQEPIVETPEDVQVEDDKQVEDKKPANTSNPVVTLAIFVGIGGVAAAVYQFLKKKKGQNAVNDEEDMEFFDDEEYVSEDETALSEEDAEVEEEDVNDADE